jgi:hypothetical protein
MANGTHFVVDTLGRVGGRVARAAGVCTLWRRIGVGCIAVSVGCGYTSHYSALQDERARVVWRDGGPVPLLPAASHACKGLIPEASEGEPMDASQAIGSLDPVWGVELSFVDGAWRHRRHRERERSRTPRKSAPSALLATDREARTRDTRDQQRPDEKDSDGNDAAIVLAALAILVLPVFTAALLASDSVPAKPTAAAIDLVNAYNDMARTPGSACAPPSDVAEAR